MARDPRKEIYYSDKYSDDKYEYRHVVLPKEIAKLVPKTHLMSEAEWRNMGVQQSLGTDENSFSLFRVGLLAIIRQRFVIRQNF